MRGILLVLVAAAVVLLAPGVAEASSCAYISATKTVSIALVGNFDGAAVQGSSGMGGIFVNGTQCGTATIANTDKIDVTGDGGASQELLLELNYPYTNSNGDIDFNVALGGGANDGIRLLNQTMDAKDNWAFGSLGINLNASELVKDVDVVFSGTELFTAQGDSGDDTISGAGSLGTGTPFAQVLSISGGDAKDRLTGGSAADNISGEEHDDVINGRAGADAIDGGGGVNKLSYASARGPVTVNLATGTASGADGNDTFTNIHNVFGSGYSDALIGNPGANALSGGNGNDAVNGRRGNDTLDGGLGIDTASFRNAPAAVTANLFTHTSSGGDGADTLTTFEGLLGSNLDDTLIGDAGPNTLNGGLGNDILNGQGGIDTVSYAGAPAAVTVSLATSPGSSSGGAGVDMLKNFENVTGSSFGDKVTGSSFGNLLLGVNGADELHGASGNDTIGGGAGNDMLFGEAGDDNLDGGAGTDSCSQGAGTGTIINCP